MSVSIHSC
uniref:Uncharacterized protein n=1 Tax=Arundo donax TaxID=35708 RepID=A0A0A9B0M3_ARUDO